MDNECLHSQDGEVFGAMALVTAALIGMGVLCAIEVFFLIGFTFRRRTGLYFWSMNITNAAELCFNISSILSLWVLKDSYPWITLTFSVASDLGYAFFGFLILYSRLHILSASPRTLRFVLGAIIAESLLFEVPQEVLLIGSTILPSSKFSAIYGVWWRIEACVYTACDLLLSGIYIFHVKSMWGSVANPQIRTVLKKILLMTAFLIFIDISNIVLTFAANYPVLIGIQGFLFAFNLKVEIWSLNQLTEISKSALMASQARFVSSISETEASTEASEVRSRTNGRSKR